MTASITIKETAKFARYELTETGQGERNGNEPVIRVELTEKGMAELVGLTYNDVIERYGRTAAEETEVY